MFCKNCGHQLEENSSFCSACGTRVDNVQQVTTTNPTYSTNQPSKSTSNTADTLGTIAKILMIISTVLTGFYLIPLCWMLPMTIILCNKLKNNEPIGLGFKICILLFANTIAGILLLCRKEEN